MWFSFLLLSTTARVITVVKICCELTWLRLVSPQHFDYCDDATLNRIRFVFFFLPQYQLMKEMLSLEREPEKGIG